MGEKNEHEGQFIDYKKRVLASFLSNYVPADINDDKVLTMTSADIRDEVSDMVEMRVDEVTRIMIEYNYQIIIGADHRPYWAMLGK